MKIYLASPYSHDASRIRELRYNGAVHHAGLLMLEGHIVYSPIAHNHPIAEVHALPKGWDYWESFDRSFIEWCDVVIVLMLSGWDTSHGVLAEKIIAMKELSRPVVHWDPEGPLPDLNF